MMDRARQSATSKMFFSANDRVSLWCKHRRPKTLRDVCALKTHDRSWWIDVMSLKAGIEVFLARVRDVQACDFKTEAVF